VWSRFHFAGHGGELPTTTPGIDDPSFKPGDHQSPLVRRSPQHSVFFEIEVWWELASLITIMVLGTG